MIVIFTTLIILHFGIPPKLASIQGYMLEHAKDFIKTGSGIFNKFFPQLEEEKIDGTGQGSGRSPTMWGLESSILYFHLQSKNCPMVQRTIWQTDKHPPQSISDRLCR
jgi:hypothetical protein